MADGELNGHHHTTLTRIFGHPVSHNIEWHDAVSLLDKVGSVVQQPNERYLVTVGTASQVFDHPKHNDLSVEQVVDLRRMLEAAGITPQTTG
jgi:hypothetical protein